MLNDPGPICDRCEHPASMHAPYDYDELPDESTPASPGDPCHAAGGRPRSAPPHRLGLVACPCEGYLPKEHA